MGRHSREGERVRRDDLVVGWTCVVCGRPILLVAGVTGPELPDRDAFLEMHGSCVKGRRSG